MWAARLGAHLVSRMHREGRDKRFDKAKGSPGLFFVYWFMQARPDQPSLNPPPPNQAAPSPPPPP